MWITTEIFLIRKGKLKPAVCFIRSLGKTEFFASELKTRTSVYAIMKQSQSQTGTF